MVTSLIRINSDILFDGDPNFRDLGGYYGADGKYVRERKLFRSGELSKFSDQDLARVSKLGIEQVIDLRTVVEREAKPNRIPQGIAEHHLPLMTNLGAASLNDLFQNILHGHVLAEEYMLELYRSLNAHRITQWTHLFRLLETGKPTLWHCTAGKDRTGLTATLVLYSLGVSHESIMTDYLQTNICSAPITAALMQKFQATYGTEVAEKLRPLFESRLQYLHAFFDAIQASYGDMNHFLDTLHVDRPLLQAHYLQ